MTGRLLLHPTCTALAAQVFDVLSAQPSTDVDLALGTGAPIAAVRSVLSAFASEGLIEPCGTDEWFVPTGVLP